MTVTADDVLQALEQTLRDHLPTTLQRLTVAKQVALAPPASYEQVADPAVLTPAQTPTVSLSSPGIEGDPRHVGDGIYQATWVCIVELYVRSDTVASYRAVARTVRVYAAAIRETVMQHASLGGLASAVEWVAEDYAGVANLDDSRTLGGGFVQFNVTVDNVLDINAGAVDDGAQWPTVVVLATDLTAAQEA